MSETWRVIPGFPNYEVSDQGQIRSRRRRGSSGGALIPSLDRHGYGRVHMYDTTGKRVNLTVHKVVLLAFVGPRPATHTHIRHLDGNPRNNRLENLRYGTVSENQRDAVTHGTHAQASKTHCLRGHEFTPENTYHSPTSTQRWCRACKAEESRVRYLKRKAAA